MNIDETQIQNPLCVCENLSNSVAKLGSFAGRKDLHISSET